MSFAFRFNRGYPWFYFHLVTTVSLEFIFHFYLVEPQIWFFFWSWLISCNKLV
jgi:hypothetical protein